MAPITAHFNAGVINDMYIISLSPLLRTPFSLHLISLTASVDVKHHVYLLSQLGLIETLRQTSRLDGVNGCQQNKGTKHDRPLQSNYS